MEEKQICIETKIKAAYAQRNFAQELLTIFEHFVTNIIVQNQESHLPI